MSSVPPSAELIDVQTLVAFHDLDRLIASLEADWEPSPLPSAAERRGARRVDVAQLTCVLRVTIPGAADNVVLNASASGVLIETPHRLCPGRVVDVFIRCNGQRQTLRATIVRSRVHAVRPDIVYRTALQFETALTLPEARS